MSLVHDGEERCGVCLRSLFVRLSPRGRLGNTGIPPAVDRSEDCTQYVYQRVHHVFAGTIMVSKAGGISLIGRTASSRSRSGLLVL
jgi:hypothetical protein